MSENRAAAGATTLQLGPRDEAWDAGKARKSLQPDDYPKAFFWRDPAGDPKTLSAWKLPFAERDSDEPGLHAVWRGVTAAAQRLDMTQMPDADKAGVRDRIAAYYAKARKQYDDDTIQVPWAEQNAQPAPELRFAVVPIVGIEVRDPSGSYDNTWTMSGYAAVFDSPATLYDGRLVRVTETVDRRAFDRVLRDQPLGRPDGVVHFNFGHDMNRAVAATDVPAGQPGSLELHADSRGLFFTARVSRDDPDAVAMAAKMKTGVLRQASFAFTVAKDDVANTDLPDGREEAHRTILEIGRLFDVCATPQGAYPQTVAQLRSYAAAITPFDPSWEAGAVVRPHEGSDSRTSRNDDPLLARARALKPIRRA